MGVDWVAAVEASTGRYALVDLGVAAVEASTGRYALVDLGDLLRSVAHLPAGASAAGANIKCPKVCALHSS
eukprot:187673-Prorocentrum_minimum.AAC.2